MNEDQGVPTPPHGQFLGEDQIRQKVENTLSGIISGDFLKAPVETQLKSIFTGIKDTVVTEVKGTVETAMKGDINQLVDGVVKATVPSVAQPMIQDALKFTQSQLSSIVATQGKSYAESALSGLANSAVTTAAAIIVPQKIAEVLNEAAQNNLGTVLNSWKTEAQRVITSSRDGFLKTAAQEVLMASLPGPIKSIMEGSSVQSSLKSGLMGFLPSVIDPLMNSSLSSALPALGQQYVSTQASIWKDRITQTIQLASNDVLPMLVEGVIDPVAQLAVQTILNDENGSIKTQLTNLTSTILPDLSKMGVSQVGSDMVKKMMGEQFSSLAQGAFDAALTGSLGQITSTVQEGVLSDLPTIVEGLLPSMVDGPVRSLVETSLKSTAEAVLNPFVASQKSGVLTELTNLMMESLTTVATDMAPSIVQGASESAFAELLPELATNALKTVIEHGDVFPALLKGVAEPILTGPATDIAHLILHDVALEILPAMAQDIVIPMVQTGWETFVKTNLLDMMMDTATQAVTTVLPPIAESVVRVAAESVVPVLARQALEAIDTLATVAEPVIRQTADQLLPSLVNAVANDLIPGLVERDFAGRASALATSVLKSTSEKVLPPLMESQLPLVGLKFVETVMTRDLPVLLTSVANNVVPPLTERILPNLLGNVLPSMAQAVLDSKLPQSIQKIAQPIAESVIKVAVNNVLPPLINETLPTLLNETLPDMVGGSLPDVLEGMTSDIVNFAKDKVLPAVLDQGSTWIPQLIDKFGLDKIKDLMMSVADDIIDKITNEIKARLPSLSLEWLNNGVSWLGGMITMLGTAAMAFILLFVIF